jgi:LPXTG-site transpeptidase (sortase) family protein
MERLITIAARLVRASQKATTQKWSFFVVFAVMFLGSVLVLARLDLLPESRAEVASEPVTTAAVLGTSTSTPVAVVSELPLSIEIPKIKLQVAISNPTTTDIVALDRYLLAGAVRYPTSAKLGEVGNVVLFGHSSYLPIVRNEAYKAFNDIQKLKEGDTVMVSSAGTAYTYRVRSVTKESTTDAGIPLDVTGKVLTLSTCDSFGAVTDRFVVTADFVESHSVSN